MGQYFDLITAQENCRSIQVLSCQISLLSPDYITCLKLALTRRSHVARRPTDTVQLSSTRPHSSPSISPSLSRRSSVASLLRSGTSQIQTTTRLRWLFLSLSASTSRSRMTTSTTLGHQSRSARSARTSWTTNARGASTRPSCWPIPPGARFSTQNTGGRTQRQNDVPRKSSGRTGWTRRIWRMRHDRMHALRRSLTHRQRCKARMATRYSARPSFTYCWRRFTSARSSAGQLFGMCTFTPSLHSSSILFRALW